MSGPRAEEPKTENCDHDECDGLAACAWQAEVDDAKDVIDKLRADLAAAVARAEAAERERDEARALLLEGAQSIDSAADILAEFESCDGDDECRDARDLAARMRANASAGERAAPSAAAWAALGVEPPRADMLSPPLTSAELWRAYEDARGSLLRKGVRADLAAVRTALCDEILARADVENERDALRAVMRCAEALREWIDRPSGADYQYKSAICEAFDQARSQARIEAARFERPARTAPPPGPLVGAAQWRNGPEEAIQRLRFLGTAQPTGQPRVDARDRAAIAFVLDRLYDAERALEEALSEARHAEERADMESEGRELKGGSGG